MLIMYFFRGRMKIVVTMVMEIVKYCKNIQILRYIKTCVKLSIKNRQNKVVA